MNVSIFGLGYVGAVTAACLSERGHSIIGADVQEPKVQAFNDGLSPIVEPELDELMRAAKHAGRLRATTDAIEAVRSSDVSIICVGTPSLESGRLNLDFVRKVSLQIADGIRAKGSPHVLIFRSTMLPGSTRSMVQDFYADLLKAGQITIYYCPEFLREGTAVKDFRVPSLCVVGTHDGSNVIGREPLELLGENADILTWEGAEMIKYSCNYFHALKVGFANEIGRIARHVGVDGAQVMDVLCRDERLNISRYYMKPGNPFGGSCLPKDVSALGSFARMEGVSLPVLDNVLNSNQAHLDWLLKMITSKPSRKVGILGLSFKKDTDDLRGSPMVSVAETLLGRGYEIHVYDANLNPARLVGANEAEISRRMPHLTQLLRDTPEEVIEKCDIIVAAQKVATPEQLQSVVRKDQWAIDVNGWRELKTLPWNYEGVCW